MPGEEFSPGRADIGTMRLNFSHANPEDAERGLETLDYRVGPECRNGGELDLDPASDDFP